MINTRYQNLLTDEGAVRALAQGILDRGYVALPEFFDEPTRQRFHEAANNQQLRNKKNKDLQGTVIEEVGYSDEILTLSQRIYDARCAITGEPKVSIQREKQAIGMPYKDGREGKSNKQTEYHYDGAYINWLLALIMPPDQSKGDGNLIMFPNLRRKYSPLISKILSRFLRHSGAFRRRFGYEEVIYSVDTMYVFFGDLSFHGVEPISNGERCVVTINSHW